MYLPNVELLRNLAEENNSAGTMGYAGDVSVTEAWDHLKTNADAVLVDVRTRAEWAFVGVPDLSEIGKDVALIEWQSFPSMERNGNFVSELSSVLADKGAGTDVPVYFLCRSGARSQSAAMAATQLGYRNSYNIAGGFEGDLNQNRHRSSVNGWRKKGLPWVQN